MIPHVYVNSRCGSFREHGYLGAVNDLVTNSILACSDNGSTIGMSMLVSLGISRLFGDGCALPIVASLDLPDGTIRIFRDGHLRAELYGWTP